MGCHQQDSHPLLCHLWWEVCILKWWAVCIHKWWVWEDFHLLLCQGCNKCLQEVCFLWCLVCHLYRLHLSQVEHNPSPNPEVGQAVQILAHKPFQLSSMTQNKCKNSSKTTWNSTKTCRSKWPTITNFCSTKSKSVTLKENWPKRTRCSITFSQKT